MPVSVKAQSNWTYYLGSVNDISHIAVDPSGRYIWAVTKGGVVEWDTSADTTAVFTRENGLPDNEATDIGITPDGLVWVGTRDSGLAVYDGSEWKQYTTAQGLADDGISELNVSPEGVLWVGFYNGDVSTFDGKNWNTWGPSYGLQKYPPSFIDVADPNKITVYSEGAAVILNGLVWTVADVQYSFLIADAAVTPDGAQWFAAVKGKGFAFDQSGLLEVRGGKQIIHMHCSHIHGTYAYSIAVDSSGVMWVGTDAGLVSFDGANWGTFTVQQGLPSNMVRDVAIGSDGRLWAGTDHGLALMGDTPLHWTVFTTPDEGPAQLYDAVDILAFDTENILWVSLGGTGSYAGLVRFDGVAAVKYSEKDLNIVNRNVSNILPSTDGSVWIITDRAILNYRSGKWKQYTAQTDFPFSRIEASAIDGAGRLYIGQAGTIAILDGGKWKKIPISAGNSNPPQTLSAMTVAKDGTVWVGSKQGLFAYQDGEWTIFGGSASTTITKLFSSSDGKVWAISNGKVLVFQDGAWSGFAGVNAFPHPVVGLAEGPDGKMYFIMYSQMVILDGENTQTVGTAEGFPFNVPAAIAVRSDNSVWIGTDFGIDVYHSG
jgi:ligand-binding sensor domain-containing protein